MKILFDTNVLIAALIAHGYSSEVLQDAVYSHKLYITDYIYQECETVLTRKFKLSSAVRTAALSVLTKYFIKGETAVDVEAVCRDPADHQILADAFCNDVDVIVSGDQDLLVLKRYQGIKIIHPKNYWEL
ncbi:MAG: putative toxin-antitoxin system toxin component, PIN family [Candidatus Omnitrophica bacterium]|nr:putative toxin-antitoxin system toxin component, PIN family [Candidatus Omnitrophota bacterium]